MTIQPNSRKAQEEFTAQVIVIGAGFAGATAARHLHRNGISVALLEARDRVGGRAASIDIGEGHVVDLGCEFVNPIVQRLARDVGVGEFATYAQGLNQMRINNKIRKWTGFAPPLNPTVLADVQQAMIRIDCASKRLPTHAPWTATNADENDRLTAGDWFEKNMATSTGREVMRMAAETAMAASVHDMSFLHLLNYTRALGGFKALTTIEGGSLERRFVGGAQNVVTRLTEELGDSLRLNSPVRSIDVTGPGVVVGGNDFNAVGQYVVVAVPQPLIDTINFSPALPNERHLLTAQMKMGTVTKFQVIYSEPFWRADGHSGLAISQTGPINGVLDGSPHDSSVGVLTCFATGENAVGLAKQPPRERVASVCDHLERFFGSSARKPVRIIEMNWNTEEYTGGCFHGTCPPGLLTKFGRLLSEPTGLIFWAGAETSALEYGSMSGAVYSGERAAEQILERIGQTDIVLKSRVAEPKPSQLAGAT